MHLLPYSDLKKSCQTYLSVPDYSMVMLIHTNAEAYLHLKVLNIFVGTSPIYFFIFSIKNHLFLK